ncbi:MULTISPECIES: 3-dehydroquinate synthase [Aneurinibacillus]|uniref:3-dehydroquinate synthase n=1 Tax=Aneurinibacillus thermoaerophilus TaxID=143495 RepID=A0A1G8BSS5_ANETH|nr:MULTISPECIES: 3-dehydroquinate synthase [Aneurinibacillus]AMA73570.1 3-dehydroquinate synthase [Aneurinibacillus sp. XH2]MED0679638.1 3-dehydroquinate synthase [Aneurinibacillus thermoaerophilus]MED0737364.1 3-dehydroquinate synthase [Aneurinibacillus thermoaerophilus]MED0756213.1 3-dehydroquinate synthase [Aneurinibacillus thermoaerophilus]MED0760352.1 3-dehydroquinate synthase [Aneurinibacillus thermoaerophilus]
MKRLQVELGERSYPIWIGPGALGRLPGLLEEAGIDTGRKLFIVTDEHVASLYLEKTTTILRDAGYAVSHFVVVAGEKAKSLAVYEQIITAALKAGLDRKSAFLALGGGVVGDLAGFVAATYMRGVAFVQIPTTLLAHDSSVGGKVAVNHPLGKNIIGAFHQPKLVAYDTELLKTLPPREVAAGFAEVIKHGMIWDETFVTWLEENAEGLQRFDHTLLQEALLRACSVKVAVVSQDEREQGLRAILNLGHTFGHAFEALCGYEKLNHGEAVAIGMVAAAMLSEKMGIAHDVSKRTRRVLMKYRLPVSLMLPLKADDVIAAMRRDKKGEGGKLVFVLPTAIGKVEIKKDVAEEQVREVLRALQEGGES